MTKLLFLTAITMALTSTSSLLAEDIALQDQTLEQADIVNRLNSENFGGPTHHWHYAEVSSRMMVAVDVHRSKEIEEFIHRTTLVSISPKPMLIGSMEHDYLIMVMDMDCRERGKFRAVGASGYIYENNSWKQGEIELRPTPWEHETTDTLLSTWELTCKTAPQHSATQNGMNFENMLKTYRAQLKEKEDEEVWD